MGAKYTLVCDNGQELITELHALSQFEVEQGLQEPTIEGEIVKLESLFVALAEGKQASGTHPDGWLDPLPQTVVSFDPLLD